MYGKIFAAILSATLATSCVPAAVSANSLDNKNGKIYYTNNNGNNLTGWQTIDGNKYYFKDDGSAVTKNTTIDGKRYKFASDGKCLGTFTGWTKSGDKKYYYLDGIKAKGWFWSPEVNQPNEWFYFNEKNGELATSTVTIDGKEYEFSSNGIWKGKNSIDSGVCYSTLNKKLSKKDYGGIYIKNSSIVVLSVNEKNVRKVTDELREKFAQIVVKPCKFSASELEKVEKHIWQKRKEYGIAAISTDVMNNRIEVEMPKDNSKFNDYIKSLDDSDIVYIKYGDGVIVDD